RSSDLTRAAADSGARFPRTRVAARAASTLRISKRRLIHLVAINLQRSQIQVDGLSSCRTLADRGPDPHGKSSLVADGLPRVGSESRSHRLTAQTARLAWYGPNPRP